MAKLVGKLKQRYRRLRGKVKYTPNPYMAKDHVTHYHAQGDARYLCGRVYQLGSEHGTNRTARDSGELTCNRCQRKHGAMLLSLDGRKRLGLAG